MGRDLGETNWGAIQAGPGVRASRTSHIVWTKDSDLGPQQRCSGHHCQQGSPSKESQTLPEREPCFDAVVTVRSTAASRAPMTFRSAHPPTFQGEDHHPARTANQHMASLASDWLTIDT